MDVTVGLAYDEGVPNRLSNQIRNIINVGHYAERGNTEGRYISAIFYSAASAAVDEAFAMVEQAGLNITKISAEDKAADENPHISGAEIAYRIG